MIAVPAGVRVLIATKPVDFLLPMPIRPVDLPCVLDGA
jgi:hypothetical protein